MTFNQICSKGTTTGATSRAGAVYPTREPEFTHDF